MKINQGPCKTSLLDQPHLSSLKRISLAFVAIVCGSVVSVLPVKADYSPPLPGLVAWWRGNGDATDSSGNGHDGTLRGGMGFTAGVYGQAFAAGSNKRAFVPDSPAFQLSSLTIGAWANPSQVAYNFFFRGDDRTGLDPYAFGMDPNNGRCLFEIQDGSGGFTPLETPTAMPLNQWVHYTATLDGSTHEMRIYVNGVLAAQTTATVTPLLALDPSAVPGIGIGNAQDFYDFPFVGGIDEVVLYNRALSPGEVASLVPEPSGLSILVAGGVLLLSARRSRMDRGGFSVRALVHPWFGQPTA